MAETTRTEEAPVRPRPSWGAVPGLGLLLGVLAIAVVSVVLGLLFNSLSPRGLPLLPKSQPEGGAALPLPPGVTSVSLPEAYTAFRARTALFLDARPPEEYRQGHLPGAVSLPNQGGGLPGPELEARLRRAPRLVAYCRGVECGDASELADRLARLLGRPVSVFEGGWEEWQRAGYPVEKAGPP